MNKINPEAKSLYRMKTKTIPSVKNRKRYYFIIKVVHPFPGPLQLRTRPQKHKLQKNL